MSHSMFTSDWQSLFTRLRSMLIIDCQCSVPQHVLHISRTLFWKDTAEMDSIVPADKESNFA